MGPQPQALKRGFTLVELMVALGLALLAGTLVVAILGPALRTSVRSSERSDLHQRGLLAVKRICADLQRAHPAGITTHRPSGQMILAVHRLDSVTPGGQPTWENELRLYFWDGSTLTARVYRPTSPTTFSGAPVRPSIDELNTYLDEGVEVRTLARDVTDFSISDADPTNLVLEQPLQIRINLEREVPGREQPERVSLTRKLFLQNG